jgi:hypothetical protein
MGKHEFWKKQGHSIFQSCLSYDIYNHGLSEKYFFTEKIGKEIPGMVACKCYGDIMSKI